jgi:dephospho-CoA kinase
MLKIGLTGNIGSGKTVVAQIFSRLGVPVFHADEEARKLFAEKDVKDEIRALFGNKVFDESGEILRPAIAEIVFTDQQYLERLNLIIHPRVRQNFKSWLQQFQGVPYTLYEAAILFESGHYLEMDKVICVTATVELRISRVMDRDHVSREEVEKRISNQRTELNKIELSDFVINNDGGHDLVKQVNEIHNKLIQYSTLKI